MATEIAWRSERAANALAGGAAPHDILGAICVYTYIQDDIWSAHIYIYTHFTFGFILRYYSNSRLCQRRPQTLRDHMATRRACQKGVPGPPRAAFLLQNSTFEPLDLRTSSAYDVRTTKVDLRATRAPDVLQKHQKRRFRISRTQMSKNDDSYEDGDIDARGA